MAGKQKTGSNSKKSCAVTKQCSNYGKKLRNEHSSKAGSKLNSVCKPAKKTRKAKGCLSGTNSKKSYIEVTVRIPKSKLK